ncbi:putative leucine-rich repeat-containing, plant-type, leucine-rich repeat domain superfamily [Helianthus annuus]|nr:putative leucine-rich repeat-containing, plant-type, leucine-rich repeat domain superfamily [Helianthus annuus]KAJ0661646.1 putative leucine-rich repeat-containing, plant-type, leucine-rich repeat domain superfamily [Helianthus annuus]
MSNSILLFFFLSLFFISSASSSSINTTHKCSVQQSLALLLFKQNLSSINDTVYDTQYSSYHPCKDWLGSGYNPIMMNWDTSTDCCDWNGVTCDHSTGDVIGVDLSCGMVQGTIDPNSILFHLHRLQRLNLAYNDFTGSQLPHDIGRLSNSLTHLNISRCGFTGQVPTDISHLHKLVSLDLSWNGNDLKLEPHVFIKLLQNLTVMKELSLSEVNISAVLPTNLNISSSSLKLLNLQNTGLQGKLPHNIFNHHSLETLNLSNNSLTGDIPLEVSLLPNLVSLDLSENGIDSLLIQPHIFSILLLNSTLLRDLWLFEVNIGFILPTYLNISSSLRSLCLSFTNLQGKFPNNILNLNLERLGLSGNNNLSGPFPKVNTSTTIPLTWLDLSSTSLSGEIPTSIGHLKSLEHLWLLDCGLNGSLPKSLGNLRYLETLILSHNKLSGEIPASIVHLKSLGYLDLSDCGLNGSLPKSMGNLKYLEGLSLSNNKLSGTLPSSLFTLPSLKSIWLDNNLFQGNMPLELFSLQSLEHLSLGNNQLTSHIDVLDNGPDLQTFQRFTNLTSLDLSYNNFRGDWELDALLSSLTNLRILTLSHSGISVTTSNANQYVNPGFQFLSLASCSLKVFPLSIRAMTNLRHLDLSHNDIQGHIPDWVGEIGKNQLSVLDLSNNSITGTITNVYEDWSWLEGFILNGNQLEGKVPTSLYRCQKLRIIDLGNNKLSDTLPSWLGELPNLQVLVLRSNNFHGGIVTSSKFKFPFPSLRVLDLSHNGFVGQLPTKYFQNFNAMKNVVKKNTEPNYIYFSIIVAVKGVDLYFPQILVEYTIVDLSNNKFHGEIPNIIGYLRSLKVLNLSHNSLTGRIPHALGKISEIESLDLSWNQLTGEIPQSLADLTFLEFLNLSQNHLVGHIPQGKQFNTFDGNSFSGNPKLCGLQLPKKCSEHLQKPQPEGDVDEEESGFTWKVVMMGYGCGTFLGFVLGLLMLSTGRPKWFIAIADAVEYVILTIQDKRR